MEPPGAAAGLAPKRRGPGPAPPRMAEPRPLFDDTSGGAAPPPPRPGPGLRGPPGGPPGVLRIPPAPPRRRLPGRARVQPGRRLRQQLGQPGPGHRGPEPNPPAVGQHPCPKGFRRANGSCVDVDECQEGGFCKNGLCTNTRGSFACLCHEGFILDSSRSSCISHQVISEARGPCYRVLREGRCALPTLRNITRQICCCSRVGKAWGPACQRCPPFGSEGFKEICPAGPGYHYSASDLHYNTRYLGQDLPRVPLGRPRVPSPAGTAAPRWRPGRPPPSRSPPVPEVPPRVPKVPQRVPEVPPRVPHVPPRVPEVPPRVPDVSPRVPEVPQRIPEVPQRVPEAPQRVPEVPPDVPEVPQRVPEVPPRIPEVPPPAPEVVIVPRPTLGLLGPLPTPPGPEGPAPAAGSVCERNPRICGPGRCVPRQGGYTCLCHPGFWLSTQGTHCIDVDECRRSPRPCAPGRCENTVGSFRCVCGPGYRPGPGGTDCQDVDECAQSPSPCAQSRCENLPGGYRCVCPAGYQASTPTGQCQDIDECENHLACPGQECANTPGSFQCRPCRDGFELRHGRCADVDECATLPGVCGAARCENVDGSFLCLCPDGGHEFDPVTGTCGGPPPATPLLRPPPEPWKPPRAWRRASAPPAGCWRPTSAGSSAAAAWVGAWGVRCPPPRPCPTPGTAEHRALCPHGTGQTTGPQGSAADVDECRVFAPQLCRGGVCINAAPGFSCYCPSGYYYEQEHLQCVDNDECQDEDAEPCIGGRCVNTVGSYFCSCAPPLVLDGSQRRCVTNDTRAMDDFEFLCNVLRPPGPGLGPPYEYGPEYPPHYGLPYGPLPFGGPGPRLPPPGLRADYDPYGLGGGYDPRGDALYAAPPLLRGLRGFRGVPPGPPPLLPAPQPPQRPPGPPPVALPAPWCGRAAGASQRGRPPGRGAAAGAVRGAERLRAWALRAGAPGLHLRLRPRLPAGRGTRGLRGPRRVLGGRPVPGGALPQHPPAPSAASAPPALSRRRDPPAASPRAPRPEPPPSPSRGGGPVFIVCIYRSWGGGGDGETLGGTVRHPPPARCGVRWGGGSWGCPWGCPAPRSLPPRPCEPPLTSPPIFTE
nr:latent-transforming growth factor beta-binding protein 4-like isoform X6 [Anas platyrhynchos]